MHLSFKLAITLWPLLALSGCLEPAQVTPRPSPSAADMSAQDARQDLTTELPVLDAGTDMTPPEDAAPPTAPASSSALGAAATSTAPPMA